MQSDLSIQKLKTLITPESQWRVERYPQHALGFLAEYILSSQIFEEWNLQLLPDIYKHL